jgi:glycosyltransferase involved in cell wall biosynthesis
MRILLDNISGHIVIERMLPYWKEMGHSVTINLSDKPDIQLCGVRIGIHSKLPKVLRLDGIYYDSATNYNARNMEISNSHYIADGIIYQSNYSKMLIEKLIRPRKLDAIHSIIHNGIQKNWCGEYIEHEGINIVVTGKHRRHKRLKEIIELFLEYNKLYPKSKLHIFGMLYDNVKLVNKNIIYYGQVPRKDLIDVFRKSDFSIHLSKRDSFPNSVVEYIGAGIPVITTNNCGGATEACGMTPGCIIVDGDGSYEDTNPVPHYSEKWNILPVNVYNNLIQAMVELTEHRRRVDLPILLSAEAQAHKYIELMDSVLRKV